MAGVVVSITGRWSFWQSLAYTRVFGQLEKFSSPCGSCLYLHPLNFIKWLDIFPASTGCRILHPPETDCPGEDVQPFDKVQWAKVQAAATRRRKVLKLSKYSGICKTLPETPSASDGYHNTCYCGIVMQGDWRTEGNPTDLRDTFSTFPGIPNLDAKSVRDNYATYFQNIGQVPWQWKVIDNVLNIN